jgi:hypothetical protein
MSLRNPFVAGGPPGWQPRLLIWDAIETVAGKWWGCRLTVLKTDPASEPDLGKHETELLFRLAD